MWTYLLYKLFISFWISLAYFSFSELFRNEIVLPEIVESKMYQNIIFYQNCLYSMECFTWLLPLIVYILWFRSKLIKIKMNKALLLCSFYSFLVSFTGIFNPFAFFILVRLIQCVILSMVYWINLIEFFGIFESQYLVPVGLSFLVTSLANLVAKCTVFLNLKWFYLIVGFVFCGLIPLNRFKHLPSIRKINKLDDFHTLEIAFKGTRTSLAFFEIVSMSAMVVPLNLQPFMSAVDLSFIWNGTTIETQSYVIFRFLFTDRDQISSKNINFCSIALFNGFLIVTILAIIQVRKFYISFFAKTGLLAYITILVFGYEYRRLGPYLQILLFVSLSMNFGLKCNDILKGYKKYLLLTAKASNDDHFLFLKSFNLIIIGCLFGYAFGFFTMFILMLFNTYLTVQARMIGQLFYFIILFACTYESSQNEKADDNFLLLFKTNETEFHVQNANNSLPNSSAMATLAMNEKMVNVHSNVSQNSNKSERTNYYSANTRSDFKSNFSKYNEKGKYFTNDSMTLGGTNLTPNFPTAPSAPSAPSFINNTTSTTNTFASGGANPFGRCGDFGGRENTNDFGGRNEHANSRSNSYRGERGRDRPRGRNRESNQDNNTATQQTSTQQTPTQQASTQNENNDEWDT